MKITTAIFVLAVSTMHATVSASNMTYRVVSLLPENNTMAVIVDNQTYPLASSDEASTLLHTGEAPVASSGYKYALISNSAVIASENFTRSPVNDSKNTLNEYYGRSWNSKTLDQLPTIMDPLPIIDRIDSDLHIDGQIPTIHITGNQTAIDYIHANAQSDVDVDGLTMAYISPRDVKSFNNITLSISGHSTRTNSKPSYKIKIPKGSDLYNYRRIKLRAMATDASYMREELAYDIAKSVGLPTSEYSYVRVYFNDQAVGLFGLAEVFKNPWLRNEFANGDKKYTQGALFAANVGGDMTGPGGSKLNSTGKPNFAPGSQNGTMMGSPPGNNGGAMGPPSDGAEGHHMGGGMGNMGSTSDLSYLGDNTTLYSSYAIKEDPSTGTANYTRIVELAKFLSEQSNVTSSNDAVALWESKMDLPSFLRGLALEVVISNSDGYFTMGNNYLLYDDINNDRLVFSGQDFDLTMGTSINNATLMNSGNYTEFPNFLTRPFTSRMIVVPELKQEFENLVLNYTTSLVNPTVLNTRIDQLYDMLQEDVAWDKSLPRLGSSSTSSPGRGGGMSMSSDNTTFYEGVYGANSTSNSLSLKQWINVRSNNIIHFFNKQNSTNAV